MKCVELRVEVSAKVDHCHASIPPPPDTCFSREHQRGTKMDAAVRHFENFWQFYDLVQVLLCADL